MVQDKLTETLEAMDSLNIDEKANPAAKVTKPDAKDSDENDSIANRSDLDVKAKCFYYRGRALNVTTEHNAESERILSRAVKLEPSFVEAWNELGESYWKRNQVSNAQNCFEGALAHVSQCSREAKFIMDGISKKLIKNGIHSTIRVIFLGLVSF